MSFIEDELDKLNIFYTKRIGKLMDKSSRQAIRRAYTSMEKKVLNRINERYPSLNKTDAKKSFKKVVKARGNLEKHEASIYFKDKPVSAIHFMSNAQKKKSQDQKNKPAGKNQKYTKRFKIQVNIDGRKIKLTRAFVRDGKNGNEHVFRRSKTSNKWKKVSFASAHFLFNSKHEVKPITIAGVGRYNSEFRQSFAFLYEQELRKSVA